MNDVDVVVIDYGMGNMLSVQRGLEHCGAKVLITSNHDFILAAPRVVLPGVGTFGNAMNTLNSKGLVDVINKVANRHTPLLGICLGMQLLLDQSEEFGLTKGLGLIPGNVIPLSNQTISGEQQKIPHIGWNALVPPNNLQDWEGTLMQGITPGVSTYFVHSFMSVPNNPKNLIANCIYGGHEIAATIQKDNITGCQFHPEKSGEVGLNILRNFVSI